ncbi:fructose-bisphosphatase class I [Candidatus Gracilibacteria bacterium]|nr:fructose-bisphosphatase class I [Candidatus Gracilibacteria bacterium]MCF7856187.1 fructose-bisphosphatase class I [Candidatus Gracilibacteria bacterium]MCF7896459.1 fructose-bisphosphatase class I [Candidatus Gracilibacteria bacterium]
MNLPDHLSSAPENLQKAILAFAEAVKQIDGKIRTAETSEAGSMNSFGEDQLKLDVLSDRICFTELEKSGVIAIAGSEEQSEEKVLTEGGEFSASFDPLDGSSLVDVNLAVGTIFGIWQGKGFMGKTGRDLVAAGYAIYGPRTTFIIAIDSNPTEFTLQSDGNWKMTIEKMEINEGKMFAPGNLRACAENKEYLALLDFWSENGYQLRYSGGMVPDIHQILVKGKGIFSYPGSESCPPKLRLIYECAPLAYVVEKAGGASSNLKGSLLDEKVEDLNQRTVICVGSKNEVDRCVKFLTV